MEDGTRDLTPLMSVHDMIGNRARLVTLLVTAAALVKLLLGDASTLGVS